MNWPPDVREEALRTAQKHQEEYPLWAAVESLTTNIGWVHHIIYE